MSWLTDMLNRVVWGGPRAAGPPRSANSASSFHLIWEMPSGRGRADGYAEVSAVLEVLVPPRVPALYFWALQVDFARAGKTLGGAHTGLQWNRRYPNSRAINWGGYASSDRGGSVLSGTRSELPGFADDPNTLSYDWVPGRPYRLRVSGSPDLPGAWRAEVTDLVAGVSSVIRGLFPEESPQSEGAYLLRPLVWSEVFAECDAPSVTVRWSDLQALDRDGAPVRPTAVRVNYQAWDAGGCPNTTAMTDNDGLLQITNTERVVAPGTLLPVPMRE